MIRIEGRAPLSPAPSRPTRGVDGRAAADYSKTRAESQSEPRATPPRRPIFDSPLPARLGHHERETERQGNLSRLKKLALPCTTRPYQKPGRPCPAVHRELSEAVLSTVPCTSACSPPCGSLAEGPTLHMSLEPFPQPQDSLTSSGLKSACGFVHFRTLVHASLCPPLYEPTRPVSSSRRDQTEDATLRSSRVSCVPGHPDICRCKAPPSWPR